MYCIDGRGNSCGCGSGSGFRSGVGIGFGSGFVYVCVGWCGRGFVCVWGGGGRGSLEEASVVVSVCVLS